MKQLRLFGGLLLLAVLLGCGLAGWGWLAERRLPRHDGRSVRAWFEMLCRREGSGAGRDDAAFYDSKRALVLLGTNAVPYLLAEALSPRQDSTLRTNLHELFRDLPRWLGGGAFPLLSRRADLAAMEIHALRPPAELLLPRLKPLLAGSNVLARRQALLLLGSARPPAPEAADLLRPWLTNATQWEATLASQSLLWLGTSASNALPEAAAALELHGPNLALFAWLARLGPAAAPVIPLLEKSLTWTNEFVPLHAAAALAAISPGHPAARRLLSTAADTADAAATNPRPRVRLTLPSVLRYGQRRPLPEFLALVEPAARHELANPNSASLILNAVYALEQCAPERAATVFREALAGPNPLHAAGMLLRVERTNAAAVRILQGEALRSGALRFNALWWLAEGSSAVPGLTNELARIAAGTGLEATYAASALARLRLREARVASGLAENEWE